MNREALDDWCERGLLALVLAILVFGPLATGATRPLPFLIIEALTVGVMLLWGARLWLVPRPRLLWPPICWAVLAFCLYAIARYLTSDIEYVARQELIRVLVYAFLFFAILNNLHRQESTQIISYTLVFLAMVISFYAIYQFLTGSDQVWNLVKPYHHRGSGTYISPNHLAGFLEMLLPLGLAYTLTSRLKPLAKVFLGYASVVIVVGIAVTVSRGSWIATTLAMLMFFGVLLGHRSYRLPAFVFLVVLIGAGAFFFPKSFVFKARINQLFSEGRLDDDRRFELWRPAIEVWRENVWWGAGPAHFDYRFRMYRPESVQLRPDRAHNDFLNTLTDWGAVGAAIIASAWLLLYLGVIKTWGFVRGTASDLANKKSNKYAFVVGAAVGLAAILFHSVVDFNFHIPANAILAVALMALLSGCLRFATERYWVTAGAWLKATASVLLAAGAVYLVQQGTRQAGEHAWRQRAERTPVYSAAQALCLSNAFVAEPKNAETALAVGDAFRIQSMEGGENYQILATNAMQWFERCQKLDPWNGYGFLRYGWCLDWLGCQAQSGPYFAKANELDPNGYFTAIEIGKHYVEMGNYAAARPWFERSLRLEWRDNPAAREYLDIANRRMLEMATNEISARLLTTPTGSK